MSRRLALTALPLLAVALTVAPAHAAKPKVIKGSYDVTLAPNPTLEATGQIGDGCDTSPIPTGTDDHDFKVPAAGTLTVTLDSKDPSGSGSTDWDLYILDAGRNVINSSHGATSHEETVDKFKKAEPVILQVCNLAGSPDATVTWTFTYKK
ncbi:MAG: hypothetical protein ABR614_08575 [Mycobacteriales bacterium]